MRGWGVKYGGEGEGVEGRIFVSHENYFVKMTSYFSPEK